jgi:RND family efflux transporter MFP subunit
VACSNPPASQSAKPAAAAKVEGAKAEADLATVKLTAESEAHLALKTAKVAMELVTPSRTVGGEAVVPPGSSVIVTAPVAGTLAGSAEAGAPGTTVAKGHVLFTLVPMQSSDRDVNAEAQRQVKEAEAHLAEARSRLTRLEQLLKDGAASQRSVEEARTAHTVAAAAYDAAKQKLDSSTRVPVGASGELPVRAPFAGLITALRAAPGQTVAAGAALAEMAQAGSLWLRVPVYAGDAAAIDASRPASFSELGEDAAAAWKPARRVTGPPAADPTAASVDLFYASDSVASLRPGERVSVRLPLKGSERALVVPQSAVVYDVAGGSWVYEMKAAHTYARRRVELGGTSGSNLIVRRGIAEGTTIVTVGAAELYSTEFYVSK